MDSRVSRRYRDIEIVDDEQFDYTGYQIVRGEFFAHTFEPAIVFNKGKVSKKRKRIPSAG